MYKETNEDFRIKYSDCYVRVLDPPTKSSAKVVKITDYFNVIDDMGDLITGPDEDEKYGVTCTKYCLAKNNRTRSYNYIECLDNLDLLNPLPFGILNLKHSVIGVAGSTPSGNAKYRKARHVTIVNLFDPCKIERKALGLRVPNRITEKVILDEWADPTYLSPEESLFSVLESKRLGAAFSPHYYFKITDLGERVSLYHDEFRVADVVEDGVIFLPERVHWMKDELEEFGFFIEEVEDVA